jgi:hypothetical protein
VTGVGKTCEGRNTFAKRQQVKNKQVQPIYGLIDIYPNTGFLKKEQR